MYSFFVYEDGGKQVQAIYTAIGAAFCSAKLGKPVRFVLDRDSDFKMIGKRHAALSQYKLAANKYTGKIDALSINIDADAGCNYDIFAITYAVLNLMMESSDNAYQFKEFVCTGAAWFTNKASSTGFRSFGVVQVHQLLEAALEQLSEAPGLAAELTPFLIRARNLYPWYNLIVLCIVRCECSLSMHAYACYCHVTTLCIGYIVLLVQLHLVFRSILSVFR